MYCIEEVAMIRVLLLYTSLNKYRNSESQTLTYAGWSFFYNVLRDNDYWVSNYMFTYLAYIKLSWRFTNL